MAKQEGFGRAALQITQANLGEYRREGELQDAKERVGYHAWRAGVTEEDREKIMTGMGKNAPGVLYLDVDYPKRS